MTGPLLVARSVLPRGDWPPEQEIGRVTLGWEDRRRRRLMADLDQTQRQILLDLPRAGRLRAGDGLLIQDEGVVRVVAAREPILEIRAGSACLARLAYHIGNRHAPLEIAAGTLATLRDEPLADLIRRLGGEVRRIERAFEPEPGAYEEGAHD